MPSAIVRSKRSVQRVQRTPDVVERIDPDEDFRDVQGDSMTQFMLEEVSKDKDGGETTKSFVAEHGAFRYAWPEETSECIANYQSGAANGLRWELVTYEGDDADGAIRPVGRKGLLKKGDLIRVGSNVLARVPLAMWKKRQRYETTKTLAFKRNVLAPVTKGDPKNQAFRLDPEGGNADRVRATNQHMFQGARS